MMIFNGRELASYRLFTPPLFTSCIFRFMSEITIKKGKRILPDLLVVVKQTRFLKLPAPFLEKYSAGDGGIYVGGKPSNPTQR